MVGSVGLSEQICKPALPCTRLLSSSFTRGSIPPFSQDQSPHWSLDLISFLHSQGHQLPTALFCFVNFSLFIRLFSMAYKYAVYKMPRSCIHLLTSTPLLCSYLLIILIHFNLDFHPINSLKLFLIRQWSFLVMIDAAHIFLFWSCLLSSSRHSRTGTRVLRNFLSFRDATLPWFSLTFLALSS